MYKLYNEMGAFFFNGARSSSGFFIVPSSTNRKLHIPKRSVSGANTNFSNQFTERQLPIVFKRKSPDMAHKAIVVMSGCMRHPT
jgi:hypothetical protein